MDISFTIKGITLDESDLVAVNSYYEVACTAEYMMENYGIEDEAQAMKLAHEVRQRMDKYGYEETDAIRVVLSEKKIKYKEEDDDEDEE